MDLLSASTVLRMQQVVAHGELLYRSGSSEVDQFEDAVLSNYARLNEERREIVADLLQRGNVYGR